MSHDNFSRQTDTENTDYEVGYRKPPRAHQWRPGQSGNPRGRPRTPKPDPADSFEQCLARMLGEERVIIRAGRQQKVRTAEILAEQVFNDALNGSPRDRRELMKLLSGLGVFQEARSVLAPDITGGALWTDDLERQYDEIRRRVLSEEDEDQDREHDEEIGEAMTVEATDDEITVDPHTINDLQADFEAGMIGSEDQEEAA